MEEPQVEMIDADDFLASLTILPSTASPTKRATRNHPDAVADVDIDTSLGDVYASMKEVEAITNGSALAKLVFGEQFDEEHVWQQIEAQNTHQLRRSNKTVKASMETCAEEPMLKEVISEDMFEDDDGDDDGGERVDDEEDEVDLDDQDVEGEDNEPARPPKRAPLPSQDEARHRRHYGVDDAFFSLDDMEKHMDDAMLEIDLEDDEKEKTANGASAMYTEFFDQPEGIQAPKSTVKVDENSTETPSKKVRFSSTNEERTIEDENDDDAVPWHLKATKFAVDHHVPVEEEQEKRADDDEKEYVVSELDLRNSRLKRRIEVLQNENLESKSWELTGEASARDRPANSALEEHLQFDHSTRQAPIITETSTAKLEAVIKARIRDKIYDDVIRKAKPNVMPSQLRSTLELDGAKSKDSLAAIYEKEYTDAREGGQSMEETNPKHENIDKLMRELFHDLDALTNFHFTPRLATAEVRVVTNMRSMQREEVAPVIASHYSTLAPEQVTAASTSAPKATEERATSDKKRERRLKKKLQHKRADHSDANTVLANSNKRSKETSALGVSSTARSTNSSKLFKTLQREAIDKVDELAKRKKHGDKAPMRNIVPVIPKPGKNKKRKARS